MLCARVCVDMTPNEWVIKMTEITIILSIPNIEVPLVDAVKFIWADECRFRAVVIALMQSSDSVKCDLVPWCVCVCTTAAVVVANFICEQLNLDAYRILARHGHHALTHPQWTEYELHRATEKRGTLALTKPKKKNKNQKSLYAHCAVWSKMFVFFLSIHWMQPEASSYFFVADFSNWFVRAINFIVFKSFSFEWRSTKGISRRKANNERKKRVKFFEICGARQRCSAIDVVVRKQEREQVEFLWVNVSRFPLQRKKK